jgi:HAD superfamily hydrolase (TIGR01484 family)
MTTIRVLATDMDGTFIPLQDNKENRRHLAELCQFLGRNQIELVYVTGRHFELVLDAIDTERLPAPDWIICDVGTSIYHSPSGGSHKLLEAYSHQLSEMVAECDVRCLRQQLSAIDSLRLQEAEKQGCYKLSYYCNAETLTTATEAVTNIVRSRRLPWHAISSRDPFTGNGLIDLLPRNVTKASALQWWTNYVGYSQNAVVFAGDSGNDLAALTAGYCSIVVGNAPDHVRQKVRETHLGRGTTDLLFTSLLSATSGVFEGMKHFVERDQRGSE